MKQERDKFTKARRESRRRKAVGKPGASTDLNLENNDGAFSRGGIDGAEGGGQQWIKSAMGVRTYWKRRKEKRMTKRKQRKREEEGDEMDKDVSHVL